MASRLAIFWNGRRMTVTENPFGRDVANRGLFRALARHGAFETLDVLSNTAVTEAELVEDLLDGVAPTGSATRLKAGSILNMRGAAKAGTLLRPSADLADLAWLRRQVVGDAGLSLVGLVHSIAPLPVRQQIASAAIAPVQPWDALICTSPSVRDGLERMFDEWEEYLEARIGGSARTRPRLPLLPLGVDANVIAASADRPEVRAAIRAEFGLGPDDILVLWVGRLSFFEKAYPQPMFRAIEEAARQTDRRVHFAMFGWFPTGDRGRRQYEAAARAYAPNLSLHLVDGNDQMRLGELWAGADIFLSLVDNIQETFGITPIEAMAAGLPVVASDWDGYRYTMRHGREAFLIPTLLAPANGLGRSIAARHVIQANTYQGYVGAVAQHTAVHVGRTVEALAALIRSPDLRRTMGAAGRARVRERYDWPVVVAGIGALADDLAEARAAAGGDPSWYGGDPVRGDPFRDFGGFATGSLAPNTVLTLRPGVGPEALAGAGDVELDRMFGLWRATPAECTEVLGMLAASTGRTVREIVDRFPEPRRPLVEFALVWMAKLSFIDWLPPDEGGEGSR